MTITTQLARDHAASDPAKIWDKRMAEFLAFQEASYKLATQGAYRMRCAGCGATFDFQTPADFTSCENHAAMVPA